MAVPGDFVHPTRIVRCLRGDETVLCVTVATAEKIVIVANERYASALAHAEAHLATAPAGVWICRPDCDAP